jgi:hypothetical protein
MLVDLPQAWPGLSPPLANTRTPAPLCSWAYDIGSGSLTRVLSTPYGGGVGGVSYISGYGNFDYVFASVMHPYRGHESRANSPLSIGQVRRAGAGWCWLGEEAAWTCCCLQLVLLPSAR